jgi:hypothetical protein
LPLFGRHHNCKIDAVEAVQDQDADHAGRQGRQHGERAGLVTGDRRDEAERGEGTDAGQRQRQPPAGQQAQTRPRHAEQHQHPDLEGELVVGAEQRDREVLERLRHHVDDRPADSERRRRQRPREDRNHLAGAQSGSYRGNTGESSRPTIRPTRS